MTVQELIADAMKRLNVVKIDGRTKAGRAEKRLTARRIAAVNRYIDDWYRTAGQPQPPLNPPRS